MEILLFISLILNLIIILCEITTLSKIKRKINIIKYYTFLQNFLALISSGILSVYLIVNLFTNRLIPEFVKGLHYVTTCGLIATMFIYIVFLSSKSKNVLSENDFLSNFSPKKANFILHYFCPVVSLVSFVIFEREITLTHSIWTGYAAIPSCLYWIIYLILSVTNLWEAPYDFASSKGKKNILLEIITMIIIPISFVLISFVLWVIK